METLCSIYTDFQRKYKFKNAEDFPEGLDTKIAATIKGWVLSQVKNEEGKVVTGVYYRPEDMDDPDVIVGCRTEVRFTTQYLQLSQQIHKEQGDEIAKFLRKSVVEKRPHALRSGRDARSWNGLLQLAVSWQFLGPSLSLV